MALPFFALEPRMLERLNFKVKGNSLRFVPLTRPFGAASPTEGEATNHNLEPPISRLQSAA